MPRRKRYTPPFEVQIDRLHGPSTGIGLRGDGEVVVRCAPPGATLQVAPFKRKGGVLHARRLSLVSPAPDAAAPRCAVFGLCGGCSLQEITLGAQRVAKQRFVEETLGELGGVEVLPIAGSEGGWGYRNKVELSFAARRYLSEAEHASGAAIDGAWLGFHAPGRFDRVVDAGRCEIVPEGLNAVIAAARAALATTAQPCWDPRRHVGFWRHLMLREAATGERLAAIFTTTPTDEVQAAEVRAMAAALPDVTGVLWILNDGVADVAQGPIHEVLAGRPWIAERLVAASGLETRYRISHTAFFQTNTAAAEILYDRIGEAAGRGGRLLDLYCGAGAIGLFLRDRFDEVIGVELNAAAVEDARQNAALNGVTGGVRFIAGAVEDVVTGAEGGLGAEGATIIVDPPRAGLHPRAAAWLAGLSAERLVYVACKPASLARDRAILEAGGWRMRQLQAVDLFPQTGHVEAVARFEPR